MKIAFISTMDGAPWGGSEVLWSEAALRLHYEGHEISASVAWRPQLPSKVARLAEKGVDVFTQPRPYPSRPERVWRRIRKRFGMGCAEISWLRRTQADLAVISLGSIQDRLEWMRFCRDMQLPYAPILHCNSEIWWPTDERRTEMALAYRSARKLFCVSRHNLELLQYQIGESLPNAEVVWNPCNVPTDQPLAWPNQNGVWKLACVARLDAAAKGQDLMLKIVSQSKWRERPLEINFYGTGPGEQSLKQLANYLRLKNVHFRGHAMDVRQIWEENHLFVLPSRYEGLPLALVEAMWCGRPAVVTNIGGNAEMCVDRETGFVAAAPTLGLFEQALECAWDCRDNWENMGKLARARTERLIPKDPVGQFCKKLLECTEKNKAENKT